MSRPICRRLAWIAAAVAWSAGSLCILAAVLLGQRAEPVLVMQWLILATIPTATALVITAMPDAAGIATAAYHAGRDDAGEVRRLHR